MSSVLTKSSITEVKRFLYFSFNTVEEILRRQNLIFFQNFTSTGCDNRTFTSFTTLLQFFISRKFRENSNKNMKRFHTFNDFIEFFFVKFWYGIVRFFNFFELFWKLLWIEMTDMTYTGNCRMYQNILKHSRCGP